MDNFLVSLCFGFHATTDSSANCTMEQKALDDLAPAYHAYSSSFLYPQPPAYALLFGYHAFLFLHIIPEYSSLFFIFMRKPNFFFCKLITVSQLYFNLHFFI